MQVTRRQFLLSGAAVGGALAVSDLGQVLHGLGPLTSKTEAAAPAVPEQIFRSAPNPECNHCAMQVHVRNGRAVRITPDPNFPIKPCLRGYSRLQSIYHPARLKYPMKRVGDRGAGKWERISWEEALATVANKLGEVRDKYGPESVYFQGGAVLSIMPGGIRGRFANAFGKGVTTGTLGGLCCDAQARGMTAVLGHRISSIESNASAKLMIEWGHNPVVTYSPWWRYMDDAIEKGTKVITIDPRFSETAAKSDQWISIKPGTDTVLALGMIKVIIEEKLYDEAFMMKKTNLPFLVNQQTGKLLRETDVISTGDKKVFLVWDQATNAATRPDAAKSPALDGTFTVNGIQVRTVFARLKERVAKYTPDKVEQMTGVPGTQAVSLARLYASTKPAMIDTAMSGAQRTTNGVYFIMALLYLAGLTGNFGIPGAGVNDAGGESTQWGTSSGFPLAFPGTVKGTVRAAKVGEDLLNGKPYPIKAVYFGGGGPGQKPNSNKVREALLKMDFVVTQDHFLSDAASVSDIVLPVTHLFEQLDVIASTRNFYYQLLDKAVEPLFEARSDTWIYTELAKRLGFGDLFTMTEEDYLNTMLKPMGLTVAALREKGPQWIWSKPEYNQFKVQWDKPPFYWFKDTPLWTASGRVEFHSAYLEDMGFDPIADYTYPPSESPDTTPDLAKKYPLSLVNAKIRTKVHSTYGLMPWLSEIYPEAWVDIHFDDAAARNVKDGDLVEVLNDRGAIQVKAHVHSGIRPGVVSVQNGWWMQQGWNSSVLSNDLPSPIANGHTLNSTLVQVRKV